MFKFLKNLADKANQAREVVTEALGGAEGIDALKKTATDTLKDLAADGQKAVNEIVTEAKKVLNENTTAKTEDIKKTFDATADKKAAAAKTTTKAKKTAAAKKQTPKK